MLLDVKLPVRNFWLLAKSFYNTGHRSYTVFAFDIELDCKRDYNCYAVSPVMFIAHVSSLKNAKIVFGPITSDMGFHFFLFRRIVASNFQYPISTNVIM